MSYTAVDLLDTYTPPVLASVPDGRTVYEYTAARQLSVVTRPDGLVTHYFYDDPAARLTSVVTPTDTLTYDYYAPTPCTGCAPGRLESITGPGTEALGFTYDGMLGASTMWTGPVAGSVAFAHDTFFRTASETVTGAVGSSVVKFGYDNDGLLTCASPTACSPVNADAPL